MRVYLHSPPQEVAQRNAFFITFKRLRHRLTTLDESGSYFETGNNVALLHRHAAREKQLVTQKRAAVNPPDAKHVIACILCAAYLQHGSVQAYTVFRYGSSTWRSAPFIAPQTFIKLRRQKHQRMSMPLPTVRIVAICLGHAACSTFGSTRTCIWLSTLGPGIANQTIHRSLRGNAEHRNFARKVVPSISVLDVCCRQKDPFRTAA